MAVILPNGDVDMQDGGEQPGMPSDSAGSPAQQTQPMGPLVHLGGGGAPLTQSYDNVGGAASTYASGQGGNDDEENDDDGDRKMDDTAKELQSIQLRNDFLETRLQEMEGLMSDLQDGHNQAHIRAENAENQLEDLQRLRQAVETGQIKPGGAESLETYQKLLASQGEAIGRGVAQALKTKDEMDTDIGGPTATDIADKLIWSQNKKKISWKELVTRTHQQCAGGAVLGLTDGPDSTVKNLAKRVAKGEMEHFPALVASQAALDLAEKSFAAIDGVLKAEQEHVPVAVVHDMLGPLKVLLKMAVNLQNYRRKKPGYGGAAFTALKRAVDHWNVNGEWTDVQIWHSSAQFFNMMAEFEATLDDEKRQQSEKEKKEAEQEKRRNESKLTENASFVASVVGQLVPHLKLSVGEGAVGGSAMVRNTQGRPKGVCFKFRDSGSCRFGRRCKFGHVRGVDTSGTSLKKEETSSSALVGLAKTRRYAPY